LRDLAGLAGCDIGATRSDLNHWFKQVRFVLETGVKSGLFQRTRVYLGVKSADKTLAFQRPRIPTMPQNKKPISAPTGLQVLTQENVGAERKRDEFERKPKACPCPEFDAAKKPA
jgi:hypothetical protein